MCEKRFRVMNNDSKQLYCIESVDGEMFSIQEVVDLLNEQQVTIIKLQDTLFAKEKTIDRLENTLLHLTEADGYLKKNRKITELADIGYNVKMVLSNDKEQLAKVINEQQSTIEHLTKSRDKWRELSNSFSFYCKCYEKAIERAFEEKPYPTEDDINRIYAELEKELEE